MCVRVCVCACACVCVCVCVCARECVHAMHACDRALTLVRHIMFLTVNDPKYVLLYVRVLPFLFSSGLAALKTANVVFQGEAFPEIQRNPAEVCNKKQQQRQHQGQ